MSEGLLGPGEGGVVSVVPALAQASVSPDDARVALALAEGGAVVVLDLASGRAVARIPGAAVQGMAWLSPELLLVVRAQERGARAVLHAMPDGAVLGTVALPALHTGQHAVSVAGEVVTVFPRRWHGGLAQQVRRRVGYVLGASPLTVLREVVPALWSVLPTLPHARPAVLALEPDGAAITAWVGEPGPDGAPGDPRGHLLRYRWDDDRATRVLRAGRDVREVLCCDPTRVLLREAFGEGFDACGDVSVVDTARAMVLRDTAGEDDALGPWATADLDLDRERVLLAGRVMKGERAAGTLRVVDVAQGTEAARPVEVPGGPQRAMGAVWADDGAGLWVLTSPSAKVLRVRAWRSLREGPDGARGWELPLQGRAPSRGRLAWSPARTHLLVSWTAVPARGDAAAKALGVTHLAWVPVCDPLSP
ncbi:MAG: hypothetical protein U0325_10630 [Polyangiales bacterium]